MLSKWNQLLKIWESYRLHRNDKSCFNNKLFPEWKHENLKNFLWYVQPLKNLLVTEGNLTYRLWIDIKKCIFMEFFVQVDTTPEWPVGSSAVALCKISTFVPMLSSSAKVLGFGPLLHMYGHYILCPQLSCEALCSLVYRYVHCVAYFYTVWPVYEVKCLCSRGREWRREGSHSH